MPPDLGRSFSVDFQGRPPHMSAIDWILWQRFRRLGGLPFVRLYFDVAVGRGAGAGDEVPENVRAAWDRITRLRIDVVGESSEGWTIMEVRGAAGPGAIGSLVVYRDLWNDDPPDKRSVDLWLVTDAFPANLILSLQLSTIRLFTV